MITPVPIVQVQGIIPPSEDAAMASTLDTNTTSASPPISHEMHCMEIIGGNQSLRQSLSAPGLDVWIDSRPCTGSAGGDIYYFSTCGSGRVTRLAVADVSGHGPDMDHIAKWLRRLMRKHINLLDQTRFARAVNREFTSYSASACFATGLLATYFAPTEHLIVCNAGHPRPIWYSRRLGRWQPLEPSTPDPGPSIRNAKGTYRLHRVSNLPLGIIEPTDYHQFAVKLEHDDIVVIYTDALIEARSPQNEMPGEDGLLAILRELGPLPTDELGPRLIERLDAWRDHAPPDDDQTIIILHHNTTTPPPMTLGRALHALSKMVGLRHV